MEVFSAGPYELGEGPVWDAARGRLWWVDILRGAVLTQAAAGRFPREYLIEGQLVGTLALGADGSVLLAVTNGIARLDPATGAVTPLLDLPSERALGNRMNDGKAGPDGAFWFGSMSLTDGPRTGTLHRWDGTTTTQLLANLGCSNGLDWSADGSTLFHIDTPTRQLKAHRTQNRPPSCATHKTGDGSASCDEGMVVADFADLSGFPDGLTMDAEGCFWICFWDGWAVRRFSPQGELLRTIELPVSRPTSCAFGGENLDQLYVTSATWGLAPSDELRERRLSLSKPRDLTDSDLTAQPDAGAVFVLDPGTTGRLPFLIG